MTIPFVRDTRRHTPTVVRLVLLAALIAGLLLGGLVGAQQAPPTVRISNDTGCDITAVRMDDNLGRGINWKPGETLTVPQAAWTGVISLRANCLNEPLE